MQRRGLSRTLENLLRDGSIEPFGRYRDTSIAFPIESVRFATRRKRFILAKDRSLVVLENEF